MFKQIYRVLEPVKYHLSRAVCSRGGTNTSSAGSAFERNCISKEQQLTEILKRALPGITYISIQDISGGCGAMFEISVEAKEFTGLSRVKQHRLITESLKSEIAAMHGVRIHTTPPSAGG